LQNNENLSLSLGQKIIAVLPPAVFIASLIFLFMPFNIYQGNVSEFIVSLTSILGFYLLPALVLILILAGIGVFLPKGLHRRYVALIFVIGVLIWFQGNILVWKYGLLDGQTFDWTKDQWRGWLDGTLWILLLIAAFVFYRQMYKFARVICIIILSCQLVLLAFVSMNTPETWDKKASSSGHGSVPEEIFEFSSEQNLILVILDAFQSDMFEDIIEEDSEFFYEALEGFTFFRDTVGSFPTTYMSVPAILSGRLYRNNMPMPEFVKSVLNGKTIPNVLYSEGYGVDLILTGGLYGAGQYSNMYSLPVPYKTTKKEYELSNSALMMDLVLFRIAPHYLKNYISIDGLGLIQGLSGQQGYRKLRYFAHTAFMQDLIDNMSVKRKKPVYKFIHLCTTHGPFVVDDNCEYPGKPLPGTRKNIKNQSKCALDHLIRFFSKLKSEGIYDSSFLIVIADTGMGLRVKVKNMDRRVNDDLPSSNETLTRIVGSALPLLLVKPPYSEGPLSVSDVQAALTDIPATVSAVLGLNARFNGKSLYEIGSEEDRERSFFYYKWKHANWQSDYFERLEEFIIRGSVFDRASWEMGLTYYPPGETSFSTTKIDFGTTESNRFKRFDWGGNESQKGGYSFNWALGRSASISVSLPKDKPVILTANILSYPFDKPQHVTVKVDGKEIGSWVLRSPWRLSKHSIVIETKEDRPDVSVLEFSFSQHRIEKAGKRPLAVRFESITLEQS